MTHTIGAQRRVYHQIPIELQWLSWLSCLFVCQTCCKAFRELKGLKQAAWSRLLEPFFLQNGSFSERERRNCIKRTPFSSSRTPYLYFSDSLSLLLGLLISTSRTPYLFFSDSLSFLLLLFVISSRTSCSGQASCSNYKLGSSLHHLSLTSSASCGASCFDLV